MLCKGCRSVRPIESFLSPVPDTGCYRVRQQCRACTTKSAKHYQAHREDLRATRQMRERQSERVTCACGATVLASYRERHYQTKRHRTIAALLCNRNKAVKALLKEQSPGTGAAAPTEDELSAVLDRERLRLIPRTLGMVGVADDASLQSCTYTDIQERALPAFPERYRRPSLLRQCEVIEEVDETMLAGEGNVQMC